MRNVVSQVAKVQQNLQRVGFSSVTTSTKDLITVNSGRDDLKVTVQGLKRFRPATDYHAFDYKIVGFPYDFVYKAAAGGNFRLYGTTSNSDMFGGVGTIFDGTFGSYPTGPRYPYPSLSMWNQAETEALLKVQNSELDLLVFLGTMDQTLRTIAETAMLLLRAYRAVKSRNYLEALRILGYSKRKSFWIHWRYADGQRYLNFNKKIVEYKIRWADLYRAPSSFWLALQYGWRPLVDDIYTLWRKLLDGAKGSPIASAKRVVTKDLGPDYQFLGAGGLNNRTWTGSRKLIHEVKYVFGVDDPFLALLDQYGLLNPATLAWERLPFSFIVDWFVPIGNVLRALTAGIGLKFLYGYHTEVLKSNFMLTTLSTAAADNGFVSGEPMRLAVKGFAFKRTPYYSFPWPALYFGTGLSSTRLTNAFALMMQRAIR